MTSRSRAGAVIAGKYKLVERLGGGGMGEVFRAEHQFAGRQVALKLLRKDFAEDQDLTRRFFQEAQAVNRIRHPNIVDVLDAGFCEEGPYVVMECLEGASLSTVLARLLRLETSAALSVVVPVLDALDAAHRQGIVHRDLKPENIFLAQQQSEVRIKLVDFGIAKVLDAGSAPRTHTGVIFGTPDYLSPEQASGDGTVDGRSDIFAVGIVLFELLTGRRPFEAPSAVATAYKIVHAAAPPLASMGLRVDALLQNVVDIALSKDPEDRFANGSSFVDMLAPLVPDGATRRELLAQLIEMSREAQPTEILPRVGGEGRGISPSPVPVAADVLSAHTRAPSDALRDAESDARITLMEERPSPPPVSPTLHSNEFQGAKAPPQTKPEGAAARASEIARPADIVAPRAAAPDSAAQRAARAAESASQRAARPPDSVALHAARVADSVSQRAARIADSAAQRREAADSVGAQRVARATQLGRAPAATPSALPSEGRMSPDPRSVPDARSITPSRQPMRSGSARRMAWAPRPLPAHVRGKCHVRGSLPRAVSRWIERAYGESGHREVLALMPPDIGESYRTDGFNALVWYDLDALDMFMEAATAILLGGEVGVWRELARENFDRDLGSIFRTQRVQDPASLLKRSSTGWARIYDFGTVRVVEPSGNMPSSRLLVRVDGFEAASLALRNATIGTSEGLLRSSGISDVMVRVMAGEASFARDFEYEVMWEAK